VSLSPKVEAAGPPRAFGALAARLQQPPHRLSLAQTPTPVERAPWLDAGATEVWVKRDDRTSPIYGGGKVRKLEWVLANPPFAGNRPIVSLGGIGSHHLLALALFLAEQGRQLHALTFQTTPTPHILQNLAVLVSLGVQFWPVSTRLGLPGAFLSYYAMRPPKERGVFMGAGASSPLGCLGFVEAGFELAEQIEDGELPHPDAIYVAAGSAGTAAGLALGLALAGVSTTLTLVSSVERWAFNRFLFHRKVEQALALLRRCGLAVPRGAKGLLARAGVQVVVDHEEVGGGYGVPTASGQNEVELAGQHGLALETTYTGKCVAALRRDASKARDGRVCLFWNTHAARDLAPLVRTGWQAACPFPIPPSL